MYMFVSESVRVFVYESVHVLVYESVHGFVYESVHVYVYEVFIYESVMLVYACGFLLCMC